MLRISNEELPRAEGRYHQIEFPAFEAQRLTDIENAVKQYRVELGERVERTGAGNAVNPSPSALVLKYFARYGTHLFGHVAKLEKGWQAFCELRDVLRISNEELPRAEGRYHQIEFPAFEAQRLTDIENAVKQYRVELGERVERTGAGNAVNPSPSALVLKYFARYGTHLFGHPTGHDENGVTVKVVERTNNVAECFFGRKKQQLRRRVGRAQLGRDLEDQPAQAALAENLNHADYVRSTTLTMTPFSS